MWAENQLIAGKMNSLEWGKRKAVRTSHGGWQQERVGKGVSYRGAQPEMAQEGEMGDVRMRNRVEAPQRGTGKDGERTFLGPV